MTTATLEKRTDAPNRETAQTTEQDQAKQEQLQQAYLLQQQRRACPGCGETPFVG